MHTIINRTPPSLSLSLSLSLSHTHHRYSEDGADEVTFLNITSFRGDVIDAPICQCLQRTSEHVFVPLCIGGGIRDYTDSKGVLHSALDVAAEYFRSGADKVWLGVIISHAPVCGVRCLLDGIGIRCQESIRVWCHRCMVWDAYRMCMYKRCRLDWRLVGKPQLFS